jgi:hypothetical protein
MPITILHVVYVWPILRKLKKARLTLVIGSMIPDFEIPLLTIMGYSIPRGLAHSLIGALTIDSLIAILTTKLIYSSQKVIRILGVNGNLSISLVYSWGAASIGALTHVLIDYLHHSYNPILWPIINEYVEGPLTIFLGYLYASLLLHVISTIMLFSILLYSTGRLKISLRRLLSSPNNLYKVIVEPDF